MQRALTIVFATFGLWATISHAQASRKLLCGDQICSATGFAAAKGTGWQTHGSAKGMFCLNDAPLDRETLGHVSWSFLHSTAAYLPSGTLPEESKDSFVNILLAIPEIYACSLCRGHFKELIQNDPLVFKELHAIKTNVDAVLFLWKVHNMVTFREKPNSTLFTPGLGLGSNGTAVRAEMATAGWFTQNGTSQLQLADLTPTYRATLFDAVLKRWRAAGGQLEVPSALLPIPGTAMNSTQSEQYIKSVHVLESMNKTTMKTCDAVQDFFDTLSDKNKTLMCPELDIPTNRSVPLIELFTMARCPFCAKEVATLYPIVSGELWDKIELQDSYVLQEVPGQAKSIMSFQSLHGPGEVLGDAYELCAQYLYKNELKWLDFIRCTDDVYWSAGYADKGFGHGPEACAKEAKMDFEKLNKCANGTQGLRMLTAAATKATEAKVEATPTMISAGHTVVGGQPHQLLQETICSAIVCHKERKKTHGANFAPATALYSTANQHAYGNLLLSSFSVPELVRVPMLEQARMDLGITQTDHDLAMARLPQGQHQQPATESASGGGISTFFAVALSVGAAVAVVLAVVFAVRKQQPVAKKGYNSVPTFTHQSSAQCDESASLSDLEKKHQSYGVTNENL